MHRDPRLAQTPPGFSQGPGLVPASTPTDGGRFRLAREGALSQIVLKPGGADAGPACTCGARPGSLRGFPQFEHGAGI